MSYPSLPFLCSRAQYSEIPVSGLPFPRAVIPLPDPAFPDPLLFYLLILIVCLCLFLPLPFEVVDFSWGRRPLRIGIRIPLTTNPDRIYPSWWVTQGSPDPLFLRTRTTGICRTPSGVLTRRDEWGIRTTFRMVPSTGGEASSEARTTGTRIPSGVPRSSQRLTRLDVT